MALAFGLACVVISLLPRQYSATALVYPNLFSEHAKVAPLGSVDAASLVTSEARLIASDAILQAVVTRLGPDLGLETIKANSWMSASMDWLRAMLLPETRNFSPLDRQVAILRRKVEVRKDARSYLIPISCTARSADEAARVVNAVALEYLRSKAIQRRQDAMTAAQDELWRQLSIYGERHPKVMQASDGLASARAALKAATSPEEGGLDALVTEESVVLAIPNRTPTSPKGFVILGLSLILGLLTGIGLAMWRDKFALRLGRHGWDFKSNNAAQRPPAT